MGEPTGLRIRGLVRPGLSATDLEVPAGTCAVLSGPSGSGKSLLLRAIADLDPNDGDAFLGGESRAAMSAPAWRRRVAYVPADSGWWANLVGAHFTTSGTGIIAALLAALDLPADALDWPVERLSTGERQRLALARALELEPDALLLDEPTSGLDAESITRTEALLDERLKAGVAILMVSHDVAQAERMAGRRFRMDAGTLEEVRP